MRDVTVEPLSVRIREACRLTGIGRSKLYELIASGDIETVKIGAMTLVPIDSLRALLRPPAWRPQSASNPAVQPKQARSRNLPFVHSASIRNPTSPKKSTILLMPTAEARHVCLKTDRACGVALRYALKSVCLISFSVSHWRPPAAQLASGTG